MTPDQSLIDTGTGGSFTAATGTLNQNGANKYITATSYVVGVSTTYFIEFSIVHAIPSGAALLITFPQSITPAPSTSTTSCASYLTGISASGFCSVVSQTLSVIGGFPSGLSASGVIKFGISPVTNPITTATSSSFTITTCTNSSLLYFIDSLSTGITFTAIAASLTSVVVTPASNVTGSVTTYNFKITTTTIISTGGYLTILFPTGVSIFSPSDAKNVCVKVQGFNSNNFSCLVTSNNITVVSAFASGSFAPGILEFNIGYVLNPSSTKPVQSFSVTTYDSGGYAIDQSSSNIAVTVTTPNTLISASISIGSYVNGALTVYTFSINPRNTTPVNCLIIITPPSTVVFPSIPICTGIVLISSITCTISGGTNLSVLLALTSAATYTSTISFSVANVQNPPSTQPTNSFFVNTYTVDSYAIDTLQSGITVTTTTSGSLTSIQIAPGSTLIGTATSYTITYIPINIHPIGTTLTITVPSSFVIGTITCSSSVLSITCTNVNNVITTSGFKIAISSTGTVIITISGLTNPSTLTTTGA